MIGSDARPVRGWVLTPEALDRLPVLTAEPPAEPPERPREHPDAGAWPDDAITVSYAELRRLVALHLDLARECMPRVKPWDWIAMRAGAVRDGEVPLLLSEVMEQ